jgi:hypothetical protein
LGTGCLIYDGSNCTDCLEPCCSGTISDGTNCFTVGSGEIQSTEGCARSDARLKTNVKTIENALDKILKLNPVEFDWLESAPHYDTYKELGQIHSIGFIAQEVRAVIPQVVDLKDNGYYSIDYPKLNALLVEGIKEQQVFIEELQKLIEDLENEIN